MKGERVNKCLNGDIQEPIKRRRARICKCKRELTDFKVGLEIPGKLVHKRIRGGVILSDTTYKIRAV